MSSVVGPSSSNVWISDPVALALYSFFFRSGPEARHLSDAIRALSDGLSEDQATQSRNQIEQELDAPSRRVHLALPGGNRSEQDCRTFLAAVVRQMKQASQDA